MIVPMTTLPTANEQTGVVPLTVTAAGLSREYPELGAFDTMLALLDVSAASGTTPSLTVKLQGYNPLSDKWHDVITFPAQTAVTSTVITPINAYVDFQSYRASWTVTGTTPSFTFTFGVIVHTTEPITRTW